MRTGAVGTGRLSPMTESSSSPRRNPTRRPPGRGGPGQAGSGRGSSPLVELAAIETPPELILFNAYLSAEKDLERERQRVRQAEVAKDKAATRLKETQAGGSREEVAAAEAEYRQRVEEWKRVRDGEEIAAAEEAATEAGTSAETDATDTAADTAEDTAAEGVDHGSEADEAPPADASADGAEASPEDGSAG